MSSILYKLRTEFLTCRRLEKSAKLESNEDIVLLFNSCYRLIYSFKHSLIEDQKTKEFRIFSQKPLQKSPKNLEENNNTRLTFKTYLFSTTSKGARKENLKTIREQNSFVFFSRIIYNCDNSPSVWLGRKQWGYRHNKRRKVVLNWDISIIQVHHSRKGVIWHSIKWYLRWPQMFYSFAR